MGAAQGLRVAVPAGGTAVGNPVTQIASIVAMAAAAQARVLLLPQRFLNGACASGVAASQLTFLSDGPELRAMAVLAREHALAIVCGYVEQCSGRHHDAALFVDDRGCALANYRRTHFGAAEGKAALAQGHWLTVVPFAGRKLGILIGADIEAPEPARALVLAGAEILLVLDCRDTNATIVGDVLLPARAYENASAMAYANGGTGPLAPRSRIVGQDGSVLAMADGGVACVDVTVDHASIRPVRRRPQLYPKLAAPEHSGDAPRL